ncbi:oligoribonuclease [Nesterenkonia haasae]|uniref:oligoribonuclease n=1 Tax=Nesterenkonia haasae TaxID=2587813 RepID=UPI002E2D9157|nr:oligoribonuclease [Nesterenkonia haasae]
MNESTAQETPSGGGDWSGRMVWIDCEMTGLSPENDVLIEVAALVTDSELTVLGEGVEVVIRPDLEALAGMEKIVRDMHTASGLLAELEDGIAVETAEKKVLEYIQQWVPEAGVAPLAGNSVHADRAFLRVGMPTLTQHLHYRIVDVSTLKELASRWYPQVKADAPKKTGNHRAMGDILDSIAELRHYREHMLR